MVEECYLIEKVHGVLVTTFLQMSKFLVLLNIYHLILIIGKNDFLVLGQRPTGGIKDSICSAETKLVLNLLKKIQHFA